MNNLAVAHNRQERVARFHREIVTAVHAVMEAGHAIPGPFIFCSKYKPHEGVSIDTWAKEGHYGCANCVDTLRLVGLTPLGLYEAYYDAWRAAAPNGKAWNDRRPTGLQPSRAPTAHDRARLWYAGTDFGPHSKGVYLDEVKLIEAEAYRPSCLSDGVLFYYRFLRPLDPGALRAMADRALAEAMRRRDEHAKASSEERAREEKAHIETTIAFFAPRSTP